MGKLEKPCCKVGCKRPAKWAVVVLLTDSPGREPMPFVLDYFSVCGTHRLEASSGRFMGDIEYKRLAGLFMEAGRGWPGRELMRVEFKRIMGWGAGGKAVLAG